MKVKRVSKLFFLGSIFGVPILGIFVTSAVIFLLDPDQMNRKQPPLIWGLLVGLFLLYAIIAYLLLLYKAWAAIQDGAVRATPGKAVGFCFIPLFNLYWIFQAFRGYAVDFNGYAERHDLGARLNEGVFLAYPILLLAAAVPLINVLTFWPMIAVLGIVVWQMCEAINAAAKRRPPIP